MKKVLLTLLGVLVILGALAGVGITGYRIGYANAAGDSGNTPFFRSPFHMNPNQMPMHRFGNDSGAWSMPYHSPMMGRGGFGFFSPLHFLWNIAIAGLFIWFIYWLFTKSGPRTGRGARPRGGQPRPVPAHRGDDPGRQRVSYARGIRADPAAAQRGRSQLIEPIIPAGSVSPTLDGFVAALKRRTAASGDQSAPAAQPSHTPTDEA